MGAYQIETVERCVVETQTGYQRRRPDMQIDEQALRRSLAAVHPVTVAERAEGAGPGASPGVLPRGTP